MYYTCICKQVLRPHAQTDGLLADFCDGSLFQSHPVFQDHLEALQLIAYFDEVEVCDPLASHSGVHKLGTSIHLVMCSPASFPFHFFTGLFYYTLGNLRPELRSTHRSIQLIACVTTSNLKKYGFKPVLQPFIKDINELSRVIVKI